MILAGGRGQRMGGSRNKALLELAGRPVMLHSLDTFLACCSRVVVVAAEVDLAEARTVAPGVLVVAGGATRYGSEWNALQALADADAEDVVAFHDAARPLVALADVRAVFEAAEGYGAAMLAEPSDVPALEVSDGRVARAYAAHRVWRALTPQAARAAWLRDAYQRAAAEGFDGTDTAAVLERAGYAVRVVAASSPNPKITVPADLELAERLLAAGGTPHA